MKKGLLLIFASIITFGLQAQKLNVNNAIESLRDNDLIKARDYIEKAVKDPSTKTNGKAWLVRGFIYHAIGMDKADMINEDTKRQTPFIASINGKGYEIDLDKAKSARPTTKDPLKQALRSYNRYIVYTKKPNEGLVAQAVSSLVLKAYKDGYKYYKNNKPEQATKNFDLLDRALNLKKGKFYPGLTGQLAAYRNQLVSLRGSALRAKASMAYLKGDDKVSLPILEECLKSPSSQSGQIYLMAADIYKKQNKNEKYLNTLKEGIAKYPDHKGLADEELHHFVTTGNPQKAITKLEESIAKDPKNDILIYNLGTKYTFVAKSEKDPVKKKEYFAKAVTAFNKAIALKPNNADYQFQIAGMYFNKAATLSNTMNNEPDDTKYNVLKKQRDLEMAEAMSKLELVKATLEKGGLKRESDIDTYKQVITSLKSAYAIMQKPEKRKAMEAILKKYK